MTDGGGSGFHLRLTDDAYAGWKAVADDQGMTTSGLLDGRPHLRANGTSTSAAGSRPRWRD